MNELNPSQERAVQRVMDIGERLICLILYAGFVVTISHTLVLRPYNSLALISETLIAVFIVFRRGAQAITTRPMDWVVAILGSDLALLVNGEGHPLAPEFIGTGLMFVGLCVAIWAKLSLRRSFGMAAANRGVVQMGPYRFVRHPMYVGYVLIYLGFWLNNPSLRNGLIYIATLVFLVMRILAEERVLSLDPAYCEMKTRVHHRLIPGLF